MGFIETNNQIRRLCYFIPIFGIYKNKNGPKSMTNVTCNILSFEFHTPPIKNTFIFFKSSKYHGFLNKVCHCILHFSSVGENSIKKEYSTF